MLTSRHARRSSAHPNEGGLDGVGFGVRERARDACAPAIADLALAAVLAAVSTVVSLAAVEDHRHVRVVLVVLDHLLVELGLELAWDHAVDHPLSVRT